MVNLFKKTISSVAAAAVVLTTSAATVQAGNSYGDVPADAWFTPYVTALSDANVFDGSKSSFRPAATMNRAEFVKTLVAAAGVSTSDVESAGFSDVNSSDWFAASVNAAVKAGFIDGPMAAKGNKFFPNNNISRAAAAKIALGAFEINTADYQSPAAPFTDMNGHWGAEFVTAAYNLSIVDGKSATMFAPNDSIVRAAVAKVAAYTVIASADPATHVRFEDGTSAFSVYTSENVTEKVSAIVNTTEETMTDEETTTDDETATEEETTSPIVSDGSLEISLSSNSPKGAVVPASVAGVELAKYDITSNGDDVTLNSILVKRVGISGNSVVGKIAIYDEEGRVTKTKSFSTSDDDATLTFLDGGLLIEAGETRTISIVATLGGIADAGDRFAMEIASASALNSNATEVVGDFPIDASTFELGSEAGAQLQFEIDGSSLSNPKLGTETADVAKFKMKNLASNEDITISSLTLKEEGDISETSELENFKLYIDGDKVASVSKMENKYLSFNFDEFTIASSKTIKFVVKADVIGGATDTIQFQLDNALDIKATGLKYGYGSQIVSAADTPIVSAVSLQSSTVEAGELTLTFIDAENTDVRKDKDDLILGKLKVISAAGTDLELQKVSIDVDVASCGAHTNATDIMENVELYDEATGTVYDLTTAETGKDDVTFADADVTIALSGSKTFAFRFDTKNVAIDSCTITASMASIGSAGTSFYVEETMDDKAVSDVTPTSGTFKTITGKAASAVATVLPLSSSKNAVIGSADIVALDFEIKADDASALVIDEIVVEGVVKNATQEVTTIKVTAEPTGDGNMVVAVDGADITVAILNADTIAGVATKLQAGIELDARYSATVSSDTVTVTSVAYTNEGDITMATANGVTSTIAVTTSGNTAATASASSLDNNRVTEVKLWKKEGTNETLIDTVSASQLASGVATFEGFNISVAKSESVRFVVTSSIIDDETQKNDTVVFQLNSASVEDEDSDDVTLKDTGAADITSAAPEVSARTVTINGAGNLTATVDNTDTETDRSSYVLGGTTSDFVASYELTATNEAVKIKDLHIINDDAGDDLDLENYVESISIYANDKTTLLATETVSADDVFFEDINHVVAEGSENIYIKVKTRKTGLNQAGSITDVTDQDTPAENNTFDGIALELSITDAEGDASGKTVSVSGPTTEANTFDVLAVQVTDVEFVSSFGGTSIESTLINGQNNIAIVKVTTAVSNNLDSGNGSSLETLITEFNADQTRLTGADQTLITAYSVEKINGTDGETSIGATQKDVITFTDTTLVTVTAKSFGDTGITVAVTDAGDTGACGTATVSNGAAISVACDIAGGNEATHAELKTALEATGLVDVTAATPASILASTQSVTLAGGADAIVFDLDGILTNDYKMSNGTSSYYVIRATVSKDATNDNDDYAKIEFSDLSSSAVEYKNDDSGSKNDTLVTDLRLSKTKAAGTQINE